MFREIAPTSSPTQPIVNPIHNEHLRPGVKPIRASIAYDENQIDDLIDQHEYGALGLKPEDTLEVVSFYAGPKLFKERGQLNNGDQTYVISSISGRPKNSFDYYNCTGVIVVGKDKITGKEISFMTHQRPQDFLPFYKRSKYTFERDMTRTMQEMKSRAEEGTIDVVIMGGNTAFRGQYEKSVSILNGLCLKNFGFNAVVIDGPSIKGDVGEYYTRTQNYFDTQNRRLWTERHVQGGATRGSFLASEVEGAMRKMREEIKKTNEEKRKANSVASK